jgi:hypothetical protein
MAALVANGRLGAPLNQIQIGIYFKTKTDPEAPSDWGKDRIRSRFSMKYSGGARTAMLNEFCARLSQED